MVKFVSYQLDRARTVRLGMGAILKIEKVLGQPFLKMTFEQINTEDLLIILCAAMQHEDPTLTIDILADLIDEHSSLTEAIQTMTAAMEAAFGNGENQKNAKGAKTSPTAK